MPSRASLLEEKIARLEAEIYARSTPFFVSERVESHPLFKQRASTVSSGYSSPRLPYFPDQVTQDHAVISDIPPAGTPEPYPSIMRHVVEVLLLQWHPSQDMDDVLRDHL